MATTLEYVPHRHNYLRLGYLLLHVGVDQSLLSANVRFKQAKIKFISKDVIMLPAFATSTTLMRLFAFWAEVSFQTLVSAAWRCFISSKNYSCRRTVLFSTDFSFVVHALTLSNSAISAIMSPAVVSGTFAGARH